MAATNVNVFGRVKFFDQKKGFGIILTRDADVFIHVSKTGGKQAQLIADAEVRIDYETVYNAGQYRHSATSLLSVQAPPAPVEVLDVVKFYLADKNFGFIFCTGAGFSKGEAVLRGYVAKQAGIVPGKGMPVRALVIQKPAGPEVISFEWGPEVEAAYAAKLAELHADDVAEPAPVEVTPVAAADPEPPKAPVKRPRKAKPPKAEDAVADATSDIAAIAQAGCDAGICGTIGYALAGLRSEVHA